MQLQHNGKERGYHIDGNDVQWKILPQVQQIRERFLSVCRERWPYGWEHQQTETGNRFHLSAQPLSGAPPSPWWLCGGYWKRVIVVAWEVECRESEEGEVPSLSSWRSTQRQSDGITWERGTEVKNLKAFSTNG